MSKFDLQEFLNAPQQMQEQRQMRHTEASELHAEIMNWRKSAAENLYQMAMGFKKMRDEKLYTALGYDNFRDYCEKHAQMQHSSIYNYIKVVEALPADIIKSNGQIGIVKLKLLSSLSESERKEITESTDLENTAVSELKKKIKELEDKSKSSSDKLTKEINRLKGENMKLKSGTERTDELKAEIEKLKGNLQNEQDKVKDTVSRYDGRIASIVKSNEAKVNELENQIKDLESRPVEVVYEQDTQEIDRLKAEISRLEEEKKNFTPDTTAYEFDIIYNNAKSAVQKAALFAVNNDCPEFVDRVRNIEELIDTLTE